MGVATGKFLLPHGSPVASGVYQWKLSGDAILLSVGCYCPQLIRGNLDANGNMTATFIFNDVITTAGGTNTTYQLTIKDAQGQQQWNENYYLTGTAANINTVAPGTSYAGPFFYPVTTVTTSAPDGLQTISGNGTVTFSTVNMYVEVTAGAGCTVLLPSAVGLGGQRVVIIKTDSSAGGATVTAAAAQSINAATTYELSNQFQFASLKSNNTNWRVVGSN